ncbi:hypothetical protein [Actinoplanes sp. G11-F43]|uniref:hypothetical protein n=1 Tax=Actinoplanes sp. G11-F43 TaxID=3424130 RepID=UPI003D336143
MTPRQPASAGRHPRPGGRGTTRSPEESGGFYRDTSGRTIRCASASTGDRAEAPDPAPEAYVRDRAEVPDPTPEAYVRA